MVVKLWKWKQMWTSTSFNLFFLKNHWIWIVKMDFHLPFLGQCSVHLATIPTIINNEKLSYNQSSNKGWLALNLDTFSLLSPSLELCCPLKFKDDCQHSMFFWFFQVLNMRDLILLSLTLIIINILWFFKKNLSLKHEGIILFILDIDDHWLSMFFLVFPNLKHEGIILFVLDIDDRRHSTLIWVLFPSFEREGTILSSTLLIIIEKVHASFH